jgi:coenzyme F420-reducing hydrogenase alpha subunit
MYGNYLLAFCNKHVSAVDNIQCDMDKLVPELMAAGKSEDEIRQALEMLVRAYDPCISCSTHYLDIEFI